MNTHVKVKQEHLRYPHINFFIWLAGGVIVAERVYMYLEYPSGSGGGGDVPMFDED
jgi:hypothetical protein